MSEYIKGIDKLLQGITDEVYSTIAENSSLRKIASKGDAIDCLDVVRQNEILIKENQRLNARLRRYEAVEQTPRTTKTRKAGEPTFPWDEWPEVLREATRMYLNSVKETDIQKYVEGATGIVRPSGRPINARFNNGSPPDFLNAEVLTGGPTTWIELWQIGSSLSKKRWQKILLQSIGAYSDIVDGKQKLPNNLLKLDPNTLLTAEQISRARRLYWERQK